MIRKNMFLSAGAGVTTLAAVLAIALGGRDRSTAPGKEPMQEMEGMATDGMTTMSMDGSVRLSAEDVRTFGITFGTAEVRPLRKTIRTTGLVEFRHDGHHQRGELVCRAVRSALMLRDPARAGAAE